MTNRSILSTHRGVFAVLAVAMAMSFSLWACSSDTPQSVTGPQVDQPIGLSAAHPEFSNLVAVQNRHTPDLMALDNVIGTAIGADAKGNNVIKVYLDRDLPMAGIPGTLDGIRVQKQVIGKIVAMKGGPGGGGGGGGGGGVSHKAIQTPPIQLGTSGGWGQDLASGYCCGGTLGALIQVGGQQRILSNYHVFEGDIVNGGNGITAQTGDAIIQPALIDVGCNVNSTQEVATLVKTSALPGNNVDCSSATVVSGMVRTDGAILEIGTISSATVGASLNQDVKKSGRTTGLTRASVSGLNATISVSYENECAGGTAFTRTFTGQIVTTNKGSKFLAGGDSGSLMVEDVSSGARAVGLLYAGSRSAAVANPIGDVLNFFNATLVGTP